MALRHFFVVSLLLSCLAATCEGVLFSSLKETLVVTASHAQGQVLKAGEDEITLTRSYNNTFPTGTDSAYKTIKFKLCYAPISQQDRAWRNTVDNLEKDKTCQFDIFTKPYSPSNNNFTWKIEMDVPTATYFVRAYAYDSAGDEAAYGQSTNTQKTSNLLSVRAISSRHATLDICSVCFSVFSVVSLFGFFFLEKRRAKANQQK